MQSCISKSLNPNTVISEIEEYFERLNFAILHRETQMFIIVLKISSHSVIKDPSLSPAPDSHKQEDHKTRFSGQMRSLNFKISE